MNNLKICPNCGGKMIVRDSREKADGVWRRRECNKCPKVIYSLERVETDSKAEEEIWHDVSGVKLYG